MEVKAFSPGKINAPRLRADFVVRPQLQTQLAAALRGDVNVRGGAQLYPSASSSLQLFAGRSVNFLDDVTIVAIQVK